MVKISIYAHKGTSTAISRIIKFTDTKTSHHVEQNNYFCIFLIAPKLPVSITVVVLYDMTFVAANVVMSKTWNLKK